jgi:nucleotide-binding universal stress UspA family protein
MYNRILLSVSNPLNAEYSLKAALRLLDLGGTVVLLMKDAPCEVILSNLKYESTFKRILVPSAGYKHSLAAVNVARALAEGVRGHITLLHISEVDESDAQVDLQRLASAYGDVDIDIRSGPVAETITTMAEDYDIIIMGASERSRGASVVFGTVVDKVIEQTTRNIFVVRA